jgi:hypothetical protein
MKVGILSKNKPTVLFVGYSKGAKGRKYIKEKKEMSLIR